LALLIRRLHQTGEWTIQSRVMAHWRNALGTLVSPFTDCAQIKLFVMAVTKYSIPAPTVNQFTLPLKAARQCACTGDDFDRGEK
jgi:hypothetical protein